MNRASQSYHLFQAACQKIPGGVNSPVRAFKSIDGHPFFIDRAQGAYLTDVDGHHYIDFVNSWGALLLGHAHPIVIQAAQQALEKGTSYGAPHPGEIEFASCLSRLMPSLESIRLVNSGTEATMSAIRLARGYTQKNKIIKFAGCYHGASDSLLVKSGSGLLTLGIPDSPGIPTACAAETLVARYNDLESVKCLFKAYPKDIAALIVEPVAGNMNFIPPLPDFLRGLKNLCDQYQALLIFDEVITGFRVALGGAQAFYSVQPDLTTLGKIIGGGFPLAAFGGRKEIMETLAPVGPVYQAGTLSGNPIAVAAGLATLNHLETHPDIYPTLAQATQQLVKGISEQAAFHGIPLTIQSTCGMFGLFFTQESQIHDYEQAMQSNATLFKQFFYGMLEQGIYFAPSMFESSFISTAHTLAEIKKVIEAAGTVFQRMV